MHVIHVRPPTSIAKSKKYVNITEPSKKSEDLALNSRLLKERATKLHQIAELLSGDSEKDIVQTLAQFMLLNKDVTLQAMERSGISSTHRLNAGDTVDLKLILGLPMYRLRELRTFLNNNNINILPSENVVRKEMTKRMSEKSNVTVEVSNLVKKSKDDKTTPVAVVRVNDPKSHVLDTVETYRKTDHLEVFQHEEEKNIYVKLGGDKGGNSTKINYQIINSLSMGPSSVQLLCMFEATDSESNLWKTLAPVRDNINSLQGSEVPGLHNTTLRVFLYGDYEYQCKTLGLQGASSTFPCYKCLVTLSELRKTDSTPHNPENEDCHYDSRTLTSYKHDYLSNVSDGLDLNKNGKNHHSIVGDMIFVPNDLDHVCPALLHILLGLTLKFFNQLLTYCVNCDKQSICEDLYEEWQDKQEAADEAELVLAHLKDGKEELKEMKSKLEKPNRGKKALKCDAIKCVADRKQLEDDCLQCKDCDRLLHPSCIISYDMHMEGTGDEEFVCVFCRESITSPKAYLAHITDRIAQIESEITDCEKLKSAKEQELREINARVESTMGPKQKLLLSEIEAIGVDRQAFHSHSFIGNHCIKILKNHTRIIESVVEDSEEERKFKELFEKFYSIYNLISANRLLNNDEVAQVTTLCHDFGTWYPSTFPAESIPIKLHILIFHVPEFINRWKSLGIFSEQGSESIHAATNSLHRTFCSIRSREKQLGLVYTHHSLALSAKSDHLKVVKRKCENCGLKNIKRAKLDGERHCPHCEKEFF